MKVLYLIFLICSMLLITGCNLNQEPVVLEGNQLPEINSTAEYNNSVVYVNISNNITENVTTNETYYYNDTYNQTINETNEINITQKNNEVIDGNTMYITYPNGTTEQVNISNKTS